MSSFQASPAGHGAPIPPLPVPLPGWVPVPAPSPAPFPAPLPDPSPGPMPDLRPAPVLRSLRCGTYLLDFRSSASFPRTYDGTLRVECHDDGKTASGDLYQRAWVALPGFAPVVVPRPPPDPAAGIPILPRDAYTYYMEVTRLIEGVTTADHFNLGFQLWRFTRAGRSWSAGGRWTPEGPLEASMAWQDAPAGFPARRYYLAGDVRNSGGTVVGRLAMGWVSRYLRRATVELDRVSASTFPIDNGAGIDWRTMGDAIGWDLTVRPGDTDVAEPGDESWSNAECHEAMLAWRAAGDLDSEWRYHVLNVRRLDETPRGIMFDDSASDSNHVPREGCALASNWPIPPERKWGRVGGQLFGAAEGPYFRAALHEIGHAMGLDHAISGNGIMTDTETIADNALAMPGSPPFPDNIQWAFGEEDARRLKHLPDIYVRPGGLPMGTPYRSTPISPADARFVPAGVALHVAPLLHCVPLGAPVRIDLRLSNASPGPVWAPTGLGMKIGGLKGTVTGPGGVRTFAPLLLCADHAPLGELPPGASVPGSMTLLRGAQGALFDAPGLYRVVVEVPWHRGGVPVTLAGECALMVTGAVDEAHAQAAFQVLSTPDTLLTLVLGGDHLPDGIQAIQAALRNPVLRPHFACIEAKRVGQRFGSRQADLPAACALIDGTTVMSAAEIAGVAAMLSAAGAAAVPSASRQAVAQVLKAKVHQVDADGHTRALVAAL